METLFEGVKWPWGGREEEVGEAEDVGEEGG